MSHSDRAQASDKDASPGLAYWLSRDGQLKLLRRLLSGFAVGGIVFVGYLFLQRVALWPVIWLEPGPLEGWVIASNSAPVVYLYLSFYLIQ